MQGCRGHEGCRSLGFRIRINAAKSVAALLDSPYLAVWQSWLDKGQLFWGEPIAVSHRLVTCLSGSLVLRCEFEGDLFKNKNI